MTIEYKGDSSSESIKLTCGFMKHPKEVLIDSTRSYKDIVGDLAELLTIAYDAGEKGEPIFIEEAP